MLHVTGSWFLPLACRSHQVLTPVNHSSGGFGMYLPHHCAVLPALLQVPCCSPVVRRVCFTLFPQLTANNSSRRKAAACPPPAVQRLTQQPQRSSQQHRRNKSKPAEVAARSPGICTKLKGLQWALAPHIHCNCTNASILEEARWS